jgi:hypothetical protein
MLLGLASIIANWHFRMTVRDGEGTLDRASWLWSVTTGQASDMVAAAIGNVGRVLRLIPPSASPGNYSEQNTHASTTLNMWWNSMIHLGMPSWLVLGMVATLSVIAVIALRGSLRMVDGGWPDERTSIGRAADPTEPSDPPSRAAPGGHRGAPR